MCILQQIKKNINIYKLNSTNILKIYKLNCTNTLLLHVNILYKLSWHIIYLLHYRHTK